MSAAMAMSDFYKGSVPASDAPYMGSSNFASQLGGESAAPPYLNGKQATIFGREQAISYHWAARRSAENMHLKIRPGNSVFGARFHFDPPNDHQMAMVSAGHLNYILRDQFEHFRRSLAVNPGSATSAEARQLLFAIGDSSRVSNVDGIGDTGGAPRHPNGGMGRNAMTSMSDHSISLDHIAQLRVKATEGNEDQPLIANSLDGYYVPSPLTLFRERFSENYSPLARSGANAPMSSMASQEYVIDLTDTAERRREVFEDGTAFPTSDQIRVEALQALERAEAQDKLRTIYRDRFTLHGRYASRHNIMSFWNWLGSVITTSTGRDAVSDPTRHLHPEPRINVAIERHADIENVWADKLLRGQQLYYILRRERYDDGSYGCFQLAPWYGQNGEYPPLHERMYVNIAGEAELGTLLFVGTVFNDSRGSSSASARRAAMAMNPDSTLDTIHTLSAQLTMVKVLIKR